MSTLYNLIVLHLTPMQLWWRGVRRQDPSSPQGEFDFEVCDIRGLEAGVEVNFPFAFGKDLLERISYKPQILGFKATIGSSFVEVVKTDDEGQPVSATGTPPKERVETFVAKSLWAGLGPIGGFPNNSCWLKQDRQSSGFKEHPPKKEFYLPMTT